MDKQSPQSSAGAERTVPFAAEIRYQMISTAAYYRAERRAFRGGDPVVGELSSYAAAGSWNRPWQ
jgi:hypothetical protein